MPSEPELAFKWSHNSWTTWSKWYTYPASRVEATRILSEHRRGGYRVQVLVPGRRWVMRNPRVDKVNVVWVKYE